MRINDTANFFEIQYDNGTMVHYPMRPPAAHQMRYVDLITRGYVSPLTPDHMQLTTQEFEMLKTASEEQAEIDKQPKPVFDVPPPVANPFTVTNTETSAEIKPVSETVWVPKVQS